MLCTVLKRALVLSLGLVRSYAQENPAPTNRNVVTDAELASSACASQISALHGVWQSPQVYVQLYADWDTVAYLAALRDRVMLNTQQPVALLPVYSTEPIHFRQGYFVFLSTALIGKAESEEALIETIHADLQSRPAKRFFPQPACAVWSADSSATLSGIQERLATQLAQYASLAAPRVPLSRAPLRLIRREELSYVDPSRASFEKSAAAQ